MQLQILQALEKYKKVEEPKDLFVLNPIQGVADQV